MQAYVQSFVGSRQADGCTAKTLRYHEVSLNRFLKWAESEDISQDIDDLSINDVRAYLIFLQESSLSAMSVVTYTRSLRAWLRWLYEEELISTNLVAKIKAPKVQLLQKSPYTDQELRRLFNACKTQRDKTLVALLIDCGLRANELCQLTKEDVDLDQRLLSVMGKGSRPRSVAFSTKAATLLRKHILKSDSQHIACSLTGESLTPGGLHALIERLGRDANVSGVTVHRFRHTFAINYLRGGGDPLTLQRQLGHSTLTMTNHYVNMASTDIQRVHAKASPLNALLKGGSR